MDNFRVCHKLSASEGYPNLLLPLIPGEGITQVSLCWSLKMIAPAPDNRGGWVSNSTLIYIILQLYDWIIVYPVKDKYI